MFPYYYCCYLRFAIRRITFAWRCAGNRDANPVVLTWELRVSRCHLHTPLSIFSLGKKALLLGGPPGMIMTFWWIQNHQQFYLESNTDRSSPHHVTVLVVSEICARFYLSCIRRTNVLTLPLVAQVNQLIFFILCIHQHMHTNYKLTININFVHVSAINRHAQEDISYLLLNM